MKTQRATEAQKLNRSAKGNEGRTNEGLAGQKRKYQELEKFMSDDSELYDDQIKSRQKRPRREVDTKQTRERKFSSGSEEEYVVGNTVAMAN